MLLPVQVSKLPAPTSQVVSSGNWQVTIAERGQAYDLCKHKANHTSRDISSAGLCFLLAACGCCLLVAVAACCLWVLLLVAE
eukprot:6467419-Amphidinium_carterae.1